MVENRLLCRFFPLYKSPASIMRCLLAFAALLVIALPAEAQRALPEKIEDLRRTAAVRAALAQDAETRPFDMTVMTESGVVTLGGEVGSLGVRDRAEALALAVPGVRAVVNGIRLEGQNAPPPSPPRTEPTFASGEDEPIEVQPASTNDEEDQAVYHTVEGGDTLYSIARRYGTTVADVQRLNGLTASGIRIGQRLRVR